MTQSNLSGAAEVEPLLVDKLESALNDQAIEALPLAKGEQLWQEDQGGNFRPQSHVQYSPYDLDSRMDAKTTSTCNAIRRRMWALSSAISLKPRMANIRTRANSSGVALSFEPATASRRRSAKKLPELNTFL